MVYQKKFKFHILLHELLSPLYSFYFKYKWYSKFPNSRINFLCYPSKNSNIVIGENTTGDDIYLYGADVFKAKLTIGKNVRIGRNVAFVIAYTHEKGNPKNEPNIPSEIIIGDNVWIGHGAIILPNVKIGNGSTIGAGAVVTRNIPAKSIAIGSPAKIKK